VFELKLGRFEPEYVGKLNFYVQLVDDHTRDQTVDDPTLGMLLVVGRDDVTVEVALRGFTTPLAVTEWRRLPAKVRQALPSAEDLSATMTRTVREIESAPALADCITVASPYLVHISHPLERYLQPRRFTSSKKCYLRPRRVRRRSRGVSSRHVVTSALRCEPGGSISRAPEFKQRAGSPSCDVLRLSSVVSRSDFMVDAFAR
jgi:hypothetical protein